MEKLSHYGIWQNGFHITVGDEPDYEDLTAEICFEGKLIAHLTQEEGPEQMQIDLYEEGEKIKISCALNNFINALVRAKDRLFELRRQEDGPADPK